MPSALSKPVLVIFAFKVLIVTEIQLKCIIWPVASVNMRNKGAQISIQYGVCSSIFKSIVKFCIVQIMAKERLQDEHINRATIET